MSLPIVLRREASRDAEEVRDYLESQQADLGQLFLDRLNEVLARVRACRRCTALSGAMCERRGCGGSPTSFTTGSTPIAPKCWR